MNIPREYQALLPVTDTLEKLGVFYYIGGSLASSVYGIPRSTIDADVVADLRLGHVRKFVTALEENYYLNEDAIREALAERRSFNLIHLPTVYKIDVFIPKLRPYTDAECSRVVQQPLAGYEDRRFPLASPEDTILNKLEWYRDGQQMSERQWSDLTNVMKVQGPMLDRAYLALWARNIGVTDLLDKAWAEVDAV